MIPSSKNYKRSELRKPTWCRQPTRCFVALVASALLTTSAFTAEIDANGWSRYENDHFIAYTNGGGWQVRKILEDLEYFRAAALRVPGIDMPSYADKTLILIPATQAEYKILAQNKNATGFAQPLGDRTAIVFPATSRTDKSKYVLHHEYAHALAHANLADYPQWYLEGFAEIASSIVIHKRRMSLYVGMHEGRWFETLEPRIDWDELISDEFDAHTFSDVRMTASAYAQYWLLTHFLTMSGDLDYLGKLELYFRLYESGSSSTDAFLTAFGMTATELWEHELKDYLKSIPEYRHGFGQSSIDRSFDRFPAHASEIEPMLRFFRDRAVMARGMEPGDNPMAALKGRWDQLRFDNQCTDTLTLRLESGADQLVVDDFYADNDGRSVPGLFEVNHAYGPELILRNVTDSTYPDISMTPNYQLTVRGEDVICFDEVPARMLCQRILHRCE